MTAVRGAAQPESSLSVIHFDAVACEVGHTEHELSLRLTVLGMLADFSQFLRGKRFGRGGTAGDLWRGRKDNPKAQDNKNKAHKNAPHICSGARHESAV